MATYNGAPFVRAQLDSILAQLTSGDELIVSDDGSTDGTAELVESFGDRRIRCYRNAFRSITRNFEFALRHARGDIVFLADQDDVWLPGKVAESCEELEHASLVVTDCIVADADGNALCGSYFKLMGSRPGLWRNFWRNGFHGCCMAFRRELLQIALPIPPDVAHDYWIGMLAELCGKTSFLPRPLLLYRRKDPAAVAAVTKSRRPLHSRVQSRLILATRLAARFAAMRGAVWTPSQG
jgi:glycosyltransferase involved in cell wall biosynthesis